jgi:catechol 2,3-dioxygenase-like lactoylglutathione lyase family enzyme
MPIRIVELHHHGIRVGTSPEELERARHFYEDILGMEPDPQRPEIPNAPGFWMYVGPRDQRTQIHLLGAVGISPIARSEREDPTLPHVALAVEDIQEAREELARLGIWHWTITGLVGPQSEQVFLKDPFGNIIELHQIGTCSCNRAVAADMR